MSNNNISTLSYKELQALALRYRVPGNIKKKLLIKVLQAAKGGNKDEVEKLLHDLRQTRKKRIKKLKPLKLGITSTPMHSPNYAMTDDYYSLQQQLPYQWVAAEEEIVNREDDSRIPHYEEFRQFLLRKIQRQIQTYDTNNNQLQESSIVDLRTVASSSNICSIPDGINNYPKSNIITVDDSEAYMYPSTDCIEYQIQEDPNGNSHGSILLKKLLQAPVGTNLEGYRSWSMEQYQPISILDNSDTLTAESEGDENENATDNTECYNILNTVKGEYFLNEQNIIRNIENIGQIPETITAEPSNEQQYSYTNIDTNQNWTVTNLKSVDANNISNLNALRVFDTIYCDNIGINCSNKSSNIEETANCHYHGDGNHYNGDHNILTLNTTKEMQYYSNNIISNAQSDSNNIYYFQNLDRNSGGNDGEYLSNTETLNETYIPTTEQALSNDTNYNTDISYQYPYNNQQINIPLLENAGLTQNENLIPDQSSNIQKTSVIERNMQSSTNEILSPFWPKWTPRDSANTNLENLLNISLSTTVDYTKLERQNRQTSCVYCYTAPIVTQQHAPLNPACSQKKKYVAENRQHSFSPYWLLYSDTSSGMRMADLERNKEADNEIGQGILQTTFISMHNPDVREPVDESEESINDIWMNSYTPEQVVQKDIDIHQDTVEEDPLFIGLADPTNIS